MCEQLDNKNIKQLLNIVGSFVSISMTDRDGVITCVSDAFCKLTGYTKDELLGKTHAILKHSDITDEVYEKMWTEMTIGNTWHGRIKSQRKYQQSYWVDATIQPLFDAKEIVAYITIRKNITDQLAFEKLAKIDSLTSLLNRYAIEEDMRSYIQEAKRYTLALSIIMVDIDNFKDTNDYYGHLAGDQVLKDFAWILQKTLRQTDKIGRWGGEEFMILLPHTPYEEALELAERLRNQIMIHSFENAGHKTASFGVTEYKYSESLTSLVNRADQALYTAKRRGKNKVC